VHRIGLRALIADKVIEFRLENPPRLRRGASRYSIDYDRKEAERRLDRNVRFIERWRGDALVTPCLGPHAPDTLTTDILIECGRLAESLNVKLLMHVAQSIQELNQVESKSQGCSGSVRYLDRLGLLSPRLHAAHCVLIDDDELNAMETSGMSVAFCPVILTGCGMFPPVGAFLQKGIPLSFGTDCFSMNALDQMRYALYATNFTRGGSDPPLSAERLLRMATCEAAECVGLSDTVGTLEVGKRADILVLDFKDASVLASVNYAEAVAYYATSRNVASTIVDGRLVYHAGRLCLVGEDELYRDAKAAWQGWIGRNRPLLERSGLIRRVSAI
jgi:5-methylthioadenosine/S-adenosylhomocysteine deaminase